MNPTGNDAFSRLWWGTRRYWPVLLIAVVFGLGAASSGAARDALSSTPDYEATALVVARALQINPEQLGRTADAVFSSGKVAQAVGEELGLDDTSDVVPDDVRLEPVVDTVALRVIGSDGDRQRAADLANLAANSLVFELNDIGPGLGEFVVQDPARAPTARAPARSVIVPTVVGGLGGVLLGLTLVGLLLTLRRPVLGADEASAITGIDPMVVLTIPRRGHAVVPESIGGLALLARRLYPSRSSGSAALVGCGDDRAQRLEITRLLARLVARRGHLYVLASENDRGEALDTLAAVDRSVTVVTTWLTDRLAKADLTLRMEDGDAPVLFTLSASEYDVPQLLPEDTRVALLVEEGARATAVDAAAKQFVPGEVLGVVFVQRG